MMHSSIPVGGCEFINITPINPLISKCQIKVCYVSDLPNRNGTIITKEFATKLANSLPGSPIVGYYNNDEKDFEGHNEELIINEDGDIEFQATTFPYGFVDLNAKVWFQWFLDDNKVKREYLVTEGYIWTGQFPEAQRIVDEGNNQSMELDKKRTSGVWTKNDKGQKGFFILNESNISKLCVLGEEVEPCFEGSQIKSQFSLNDDFLSRFSAMVQELKDILGEGGTNMNDTLETMETVVETPAEEPVVEETPVVEVSTEETPVVEEETPVEENSAENFSEDQGQNSETEIVENSETNEGIVENESTEEIVVEESTIETPAAQEYSLDDIPEYTELRTKYSTLQSDYETLQNNYSSLEEEIKTLRAFKLESDRKEKQALINKFCMLSDEDKADVIAHIDEYSLEKIEADLAVICFRNKVSFSVEEETQETDSLTYNLNVEDELDNTPAWIKAVRETAKNM